MQTTVRTNRFMPCQSDLITPHAIPDQKDDIAGPSGGNIGNMAFSHRSFIKRNIIDIAVCIRLGIIPVVGKHRRGQQTD